jgi:DNA-binding NtrC family response regulator
MGPILKDRPLISDSSMINPGNIGSEKMRHKVTLLLVEDDLVWQKYYKNLLEGAGYKVETAEGAQDAFGKFVDEDPDIVVSGVFMPDKELGINIKWLLNKIKEERTGASVILLTSLDWLINNFADEADGFVLKRPGEEETLIEKIEELLGKKHRL